MKQELHPSPKAYTSGAIHQLSVRMARTVDAASNVPALIQHADALESAWVRLYKLIGSLQKTNDAEQGVNASAHLDAFGHIVVGWLWLDQALVARRLVEEGSADDVHRDTLASCDCFFDRDLPNVAGLLAQV